MRTTSTAATIVQAKEGAGEGLAVWGGFKKKGGRGGVPKETGWGG